MLIESVLATTAWGIVPLFEKQYTSDLSLSTIVIISLICLMILAPIYIYLTRDEWVKDIPYILTSKRNTLFYAVIGVGLSIIAWKYYLLAIQRSNDRTYLVVALTCTYPIITAILLFIFFKENITLQGWLGIILVIFGIICLIKK